MDEVLHYLEAVESERRARDGDPRLQARVLSIKRFQQRRFEWTYRDLLVSRRFGPAARFFLDDLYGPQDFRQRDRQFARVVPHIESVFPAVLNQTVLDLARLHALSEGLDSAMARCMVNEVTDADGYLTAWMAVGRPQDRERQLDLVLAIGHSLERLTRHAWLVLGLKMMRGPARAAGMLDLQRFLEQGLASFRAMDGATEFLAFVDERERKMMKALFAGDGTFLTLVEAPSGQAG
jgi:hypothetical protein